MNTNQNVNSTRVVTNKVRLSFVHLFTPYANLNGGEPKYSTTILIPKTDVKVKQEIDAAMQAAIQSGINSKWNGVRPAVVKHPLWDGDGVRANGEAFGEECRGHWVITASSKQQPQVVDQQLKPIMNQSEIYSGVYARVSINFFPYFNSGNKGIGCGLGNVQKIEDGEPLGGRSTAEEDFDVIPQQFQQPQQQFQQPTQQYQAIDPITGLPIR